MQKSNMHEIFLDEKISKCPCCGCWLNSKYITNAHVKTKKHAKNLVKEHLIDLTLDDYWLEN